MKFDTRTLLIALTYFAASPTQAAFTVYDPNSGFSSSQNPSGPWSYGYSTTLGGAMSLYTIAGTSNSLDFWTANINNTNTPLVQHNPTNGQIMVSTVKTEANEITLHPGPNGEFSIIRFTALFNGSYYVSGGFVGRDFAFPTTTDVHVMVNSIAVFNGNVAGYDTPSYLGFGPPLMTLNTGDTVDFVVGQGSNNNYYGDTTGLDLIIEGQAVPEPSTPLLFGLSGLGLFRHRRNPN